MTMSGINFHGIGCQLQNKEDSQVIYKRIYQKDNDNLIRVQLKLIKKQRKEVVTPKDKNP